MAGFFASGHAVDLVLGVLAIEAIWLASRGWRAGEIAALLLPAALILLGLRAALTGADWYWVALPLAASFPVHLTDVILRERRRPTDPGKSGI